MNVRNGSRAVRRTLLAVILAGAAFVTAAVKPFAPGVTFKIRMVITPPEIPGMAPQGEMVVVGHGLATGGRSRLDLDSVAAPMQAGGTMAPGDFMLSLDSGRMVVVRPSTKSYSEGLPGMGMLPADALAAAVITNVSVASEKLGAGDAMQGFPTQHFRVTTQYGLAIMGQSFNTTTVQEIWTADLGTAVSTPFDGAIPTEMSQGPMKELFDKTLAARKDLGTGVPIKSVSTTSITGPMSLTTLQTYDLSEITRGNVDDTMLKIPDGFTKKP